MEGVDVGRPSRDFRAGDQAVGQGKAPKQNAWTLVVKGENHPREHWFGPTSTDMVIVLLFSLCFTDRGLVRGGEEPPRLLDSEAMLAPGQPCQLSRAIAVELMQGLIEHRERERTVRRLAEQLPGAVGMAPGDPTRGR
jgi:hypothetical protein